MDVPLPVITATLSDRRDRAYLAWVAVANEIAHLPLDMAPIDASTHALEVVIDGIDTLVLLADPMGEPTSEGFPLRLRPLDEAHAAQLSRELFGSTTPEGPPAAAELSLVTPLPTLQSIRRSNTEPPPLSADHRASLARGTGGYATTSTHQPSIARRAPGALVGRVLGDGRFIVEELLGGGASGEVYRAVHTALRRSVAVKVLHTVLQQLPDYCARFYGEALGASRLDHPNVLRVIDYGQESDGILYIVMELATGGTLQDAIDKRESFSLDRIVQLVSQVCAGLANAHDSGMVHRDIKPANIMVVQRRDDEGNAVELVKVCDFGIAHWSPGSRGSLADNEATLIDMPQEEMLVGTPAYMAPEQIRGDAVDGRTDLYALGVVLYELVTGRVPFDSPAPHAVLAMHVNESPTPPSAFAPDLDPGLEALILSALEKDPARRPRDARAFRAALRDLLGFEQRLSTSRLAVIRGVVKIDDVLSQPDETLKGLAQADEKTRVRALPVVAQGIERAVAQGDFKLACSFVRWLGERYADASVSADEREAVERALHGLRDPEAMRSVAERALAANGLAPDDETLTLLGAGGPVAALALIEARKRRGPSLELRGRFVASVKAIGPSALPTLIAALEPLVNVATKQEEILVEDLLRAMPRVPSDPAGELAFRLIHLDKPSLAVAALAATASFWGMRARPLLVGILDVDGDTIRMVAIEALRALGGFDERDVERLAAIAFGTKNASQELRIAAASALGFPTATARPRAAALIEQRLVPPQAGFFGSLKKALGPTDDAAVVLVLARTLTALAPDRAPAVLERVASTRPDVKQVLEGIKNRR